MGRPQHEPWRHADSRHTPGSLLVGEALGEGHQRGLAAAVDRYSGHGYLRVLRRDHHDPPRAPTDHARQNGVCHVQRSAQVNPDDQINFGLRHLDERPRTRHPFTAAAHPARAPYIGNEDVDATTACLHLGDGTLHLLPVADVSDHRECRIVAPPLANLFRADFGSPPVDVEHRDSGAELGQTVADSIPEPIPTPSCHDRRLAVEPHQLRQRLLGSTEREQVEMQFPHDVVRDPRYIEPLHRPSLQRRICSSLTARIAVNDGRHGPPARLWVEGSRPTSWRGSVRRVVRQRVSESLEVISPGYLSAAADAACAVTGFTYAQLFFRAPLTDDFRLVRTTGTVPPAPEASPADAAFSLSGRDSLIQELSVRRRALLAAEAGPIGHVGGANWLAGRTGSARVLVQPVFDAEALSGFIVLNSDVEVSVDDRILERIAALARLVGAGLDELRDAADLAARHDELARKHQTLRTVHAVDRRIGRAACEGGSVLGIVSAGHELSGKPVAAFDGQNRLIARSAAQPSGGLDFPAIETILAVAGPVTITRCEPRTVEAHPSAGVRSRLTITAVVHAGEHLGWIVVLEQPARLRAFDELVARRAAEQVGREIAVLRRVASASWNARSAITRQLIGGTSNPDDLRSSGHYLGIDTEATRVLVYLIGREGHEGVIDEALVAKEVERRLGLEVLATRGSEGVVLLVAAPPDSSPLTTVRMVKHTMDDVCAHGFFEADLIVGVSSVTEPAGLAHAYREAREVAHCIDRFATNSSARVLAVDDLGPARLFVANSDVSAVRSFVDDILGRLLTGPPTTTQLLLTLQTYFEAGRSVRLSAEWMRVHENTIRMRMARVRSITGLDVLGDSNDQLSVQTALLVLRLQGHPELPSFEETDARPDRRIGARERPTPLTTQRPPTDPIDWLLHQPGSE